jgi:hypothetical protein
MKKDLITIIFLLSYLSLWAQTTEEDQSQLNGPLVNPSTEFSWSGTYIGNIMGTSSSLTVQQEGKTIQGRIDADGYIYQVTGSAKGNQFDGELLDPQTQGRMPCMGFLENEKISLTIGDAQSGQAIQLAFSKTEVIGTATDSHMGNDDGAVSTERDPNLVGNWLYSESYTSGSYSFASQWRLIVNADGTYLYGDAKMAGGGPGTSAQSGGGDYTRGQWKTQNKTIYINEGYGWQPYAGYYIEGNSMLMKFADGSKQVWKRY